MGGALNTMLAPEDRNLKEQSSKVQMPRGFGEEKMFKLHIDWHIQILLIIKQAKVEKKGQKREKTYKQGHSSISILYFKILNFIQLV